MKKIIVSFLFGVVFTLGCLGLLISPWWHAFLSPTKNAKCLPMDYPEPPFDSPAYRYKPEPYIPDVDRIETPIETVKAYYETNLRHNSDWNYEEGLWARSEVRPGEFLYECGAGLNWEEAELGCIYLRERDGLTVVEIIWLYSATSAPPCESYMSELPLYR